LWAALGDRLSEFRGPWLESCFFTSEMRPNCPHCKESRPPYGLRKPAVRRGSYYRKSDGRVVARFRCKSCLRGFSFATLQPCYRQNKRHVNDLLGKLLCSGVSQRRAARVLNLNRITVVRKFLFLASRSKLAFEKRNRSRALATRIQFDDMETFEHTKLKPLSITLAVEYRTRRILGFEVSKMAANGRLAAFSRKKYGIRRDQRASGRKRLFFKLQKLVDPGALIESDQNPHYPYEVKSSFPGAVHQAHRGRRGSTTGQGELKKVRFDPLFSLNHTCAMARANINRLFRKTWCTTKKPDRLYAHLCLYAHYHNSQLI
jgi:transposase-like protein